MLGKVLNLLGLVVVVSVGALMLLAMLAEVTALLGLGYLGLRDRDWGLLIFVAVLCGVAYAAVLGGLDREGLLGKDDEEKEAAP